MPSRSPRLSCSRCAWALGAALASALAAVACGPSFQVVYEGDARFEHCYAIDDTPTVGMQEKTDCWTEWMTRYTYGQTRNRVDYAAMRAKALQEAHATPTDEAVMGAAPGGGTGHVIGQDEPVPTNAFATPPKTMSEGDAGADAQPSVAADHPPASKGPAKPATAPSDDGPPPPATTCTSTCRGTWQTCRTACKTGPCAACDKSYSGCMKKCF